MQWESAATAITVSLLQKQRSSRNAYRSVPHKSLLGKLGRLQAYFRDMGSISLFAYAIGTLRRVLLFYLFCENRKNRKDSNIMKKTVHSALGILLSLLFVVCLVSCGNTVNATGVWEKATYLKNAEFGKGTGGGVG